MNGAIEVSGEANPLTAQTLYQALTSASSTNQQQVKTGTQQLQNWEQQPGFHSSLQVRATMIDSSFSAALVANTKSSPYSLILHFQSRLGICLPSRSKMA